MSMHAFLCSPVSKHRTLTGTNFPTTQSHYHLLHGMVFYLPNHHSSVPFDEHVTFLPVAFSYFASPSTTKWLVSDVHVSICTVLHPHSDTSGTHAGISTHTMKSLTDPGSSVLLHTEFKHCMSVKP